jgi:hypothetical protein
MLVALGWASSSKQTNSANKIKQLLQYKESKDIQWASVFIDNLVAASNIFGAIEDAQIMQFFQIQQDVPLLIVSRYRSKQDWFTPHH